MTRSTEENILDEITNHYLSSEEFKGLPISDLFVEFEDDPDTILEKVSVLIENGKVCVIHAESQINPYINRTGFEPVEDQINKLTTDSSSHSCLYPSSDQLKGVIDKSQFSKEPYKLRLALGEPQLSYQSFDLSVLEVYRNDPRYEYKTTDIDGSISIKDQYYETKEIENRDQILLQSFGFSYDDEFNRAVAVFLRYLADLSPEHQQIWKAKELSGDFELHPDYYRTSILGEWGERVSIFDAFLKEFWLINEMARRMGKPPLFRNDFGEYGEEKPRKFAFLIRPTLEEYNNFILLLDKMLSDNLNKKFFDEDISDKVEEADRDGKIRVRNKGTLSLLDEWIRKYFRPDDWGPWDKSIKSLKKIRKKRQKPAHAINENEFDQQYFAEQREIVIEAYQAVRTLRMILENHPDVQSSDIVIPDWLSEGKIWTY